MGSIWIAIDTQLRRRVALKFMSSESIVSPAARVRFGREAMAIARLQHPHVIQVYDYGIDNDVPFIVMELLEGEDLDARLRRQRQLPLAAVINLIAQIARALDTAHAARIIHRDLKPGNIFIARVGGDELIKILDFGVATMFAERSPTDDKSEEDVLFSMVGTPAYMSPEQIQKPETVDHRADIWALGVIAYQALTGRLPFEGQTLAALFSRVVEGEHTPATMRVQNLVADVDEFFRRALAKDPEQRFQSARELALALAAVGAADKTQAAVKILVVDDEPNIPLLIRQRFRHQIRKNLYQFLFASDGEGALDELRRNPDVDVVFTDLNMPRMDGITLLERVGEVSPFAKTIVVSAYGDIPNFRKAMNRGAFDFLVKPIDFKDFEITLEKASKHVRALRRTLEAAEENDTLRMFVSSGILESISKKKSGALGVTPSETIEATVAFIGVFGFFDGARGAAPDDDVFRLNASLDVIVAEIVANSGSVDRFLNSAVMAVFRGRAHAERAVRACVTIRARIAALALDEGPRSPYAHGVSAGIDTGSVIAGDIGSKVMAQLSYTVLGRPVAAALLLASIAGKNQILVNEGTRAAASAQFELAPVEDIDAKSTLLRDLGAVSAVLSTTPGKSFVPFGTDTACNMETMAQVPELPGEVRVMERE
jgi:serine/threonine protein kinase